MQWVFLVSVKMSDMSKLIRLVQQYETISVSSPIIRVVASNLNVFQRASKIFDI